MGRVPYAVRRFLCVALALLPLAVSACGGGSESPPAGRAAVGVVVGSADAFPAGTTFASPAAASGAPPASVPLAASTPAFDNLVVAVTRIALIPSGGSNAVDNGGQLEAANAPDEEGPSGRAGFVTVTLPAPVAIDLLHPPTGVQVARLLNRFDAVPAGAYGKIRVYYDNVVGWSGGVPSVFHPTAHYHFDVHFVGGDLVIPTATDPAGGIRLFSVAIKVVGLKYHATGSGSFLLRPQVFAEVESLRYLVSGTARNVDRVARTLDVVTAGGVVVHAAWDALTGWFLADGRTVDVPAVFGESALDDRAVVDVAGVFGPGGTLAAGSIGIAFPDARRGAVDGGWLPDNTFVLRLPADNVVLPQPGRAGAVYDSALFPYARLSDAAVADNVAAVARGYAVPGGIRAFWITLGP